MLLSFEQIKDITQGACSIKNEEGYVVFRRFTDEQLYLYSNKDKPRKTITSPETRSLSSSGIKLCFRTNSKSITITAKFCPIICRALFSMDIFCNGNPLGRISNIETLPDCNYVGWHTDEKEITKTYNLTNDENEITIYFPYSTDTRIKEIALDDNSFIVPIKPQKKLLAFGDSITHGYDSLFSANSYTNRLADKLNYEIFNKGIGGEIYFPDLAKTKEAFIPDLITVAYGTNDWGNITSKEFIKNCQEFYENLTKTYPKTKIFALTPIWRKEILTEQKVFGDFSLVKDLIIKITEKYKNVTVINCFDFIPHDSKFFSDGRLHPNDLGFKHYADNLYNQIKQYI